MKWIQITASCQSSDVDTVCAVMSVYDAHLQIDDPSDVVEANPVYGELIDESLLNRKDKAKISIYLSELDECDRIINGIKEKLDSCGLDYDIASEVIDEEDWANNWKQYYKPVSIGSRLVIVPEWEEYGEKPGEVIVRMDPGMAFGSGTHETTQLCAELLEEKMPAGVNVLDVGTGSGILAIAASKLGAKEVKGYDIDPVAVKVASENAELNGCDNVTFAVSDLLGSVSGVFGFACANITAEIVIRLSGGIASYLLKGAYLAVSGVIDEQRDDVVEAMRRGGMILEDERHLNGWSGLLFKRI